MIWIDFVMEGTVVMPEDALHAIGPWSRGAQIEAEDLLDLLFGIRVQQMIGDRADHLVALVAPGRRGGGIKEAEQAIEREDYSQETYSQHEKSRSVVAKRPPPKLLVLVVFVNETRETIPCTMQACRDEASAMTDILFGDIGQ
jgi:hypothetical protein